MGERGGGWVFTWYITLYTILVQKWGGGHLHGNGRLQGTLQYIFLVNKMKDYVFIYMYTLTNSDMFFNA